jgi:hypothetical protein
MMAASTTKVRRLERISLPDRRYNDVNETTDEHG